MKDNKRFFSSIIVSMKHGLGDDDHDGDKRKEKNKLVYLLLLKLVSY